MTGVQTCALPISAVVDPAAASSSTAKPATPTTADTAPNPEKAPAPEPAPTAKAPETARIAALVEQLGSTDYEKREAATKELAAIGKPALPALEATSKDLDAERASRAKDLAIRIGASDEEARAPEIPGLAEAMRGMAGPSTTVVNGNGGVIQLGVQVAGGRAAAGGPGGHVNTRFEMTDGESRRTVENDKGSATVAEGKNGFSLTLTPKDGEARTFPAGSRAEFAKKYPNLYAKYFGK